MFYLIPLTRLVIWRRVRVLRGRSPILLRFWLRGITGTLVYLLLTESCLGGGTLLYLVEERLSLFIILRWLLLGGGVFLLFFLVIKGALSPLHKWFVEALRERRTQVLVWGLTFHKFPLLLLIREIISPWRIRFLSLSFLRGAVLIFKLGETRGILILSSRNSLVLIVLLLILDLSGGFILLLCYIGVFWRGWILREQRINRIFLLLGIIGFPPFLFFQLKWRVFFLLLNRRELLSLFLAVSSGVAAVAYVRLALLFDFSVLRWRELSFLLLWIGRRILLPAC